MASRLALFTLCTLSSLLISVSADGLSLKVTGPAHVDDISALHIIATLTNTGSSPLTLVNDPRSVLSTTPTDTFSISHESGASPAFTGILVKFSYDIAIEQGGITRLGPGQSIDVTHSLADAYDFKNSGAGTYEISPSTLFHAVSEGGNAQPMYATLETSHKVVISGTGILVLQQSGQEKQNTLLMKRAATFRRCNSTQQTQINLAIPSAARYVSDSIAYLKAHSATTTRFTTWFGPFSRANRDTILKHYQSINLPGSFRTWTYDCAGPRCIAGYLAYVEVNTYRVVYICERFYSRPNTGIDSRAGTLVHEATHFTKTAGTKDWSVNGQQNCKNLAVNNPARALQNADSHQYFSENTPVLA